MTQPSKLGRVDVAARWLALICLGLAPLVQAQPVAPHAPAPGEFASQIPLEVSGDNGVVQLLLPLAVYQQSQSAELADLRVYNSAGLALPYALYRPSYRTRVQFRESATALYPIFDRDAPAGADVALSLRANQDGSLSVDARGGSAAAADLRLTALILDLGNSGANEVLESLSFDLPEANADYRAQLAIERSDDLKLWDGVALGSLSWISASDASGRLVSDRIDLPGGEGRYLKIRWLEGDPLSFAAIRARWRSASITPDPTLEVRASGQPGRQAGDFVYSVSPAIPATEIGLDLPEPNTVMPVSMGFYREQRQTKQRWWLDTRVQSTFYRLTHNGRERVSSRISVAPLAGSEWVVRAATPGQAAPTLVLRWQPQTMVFNAQGSGFHLSVGASNEQVAHFSGGPVPLSQVAPGYSADEILQLERAQIGSLQATPSVPLQAASAVESAADALDQEARKRRFILWSVLALGVLVLAAMSWRLYAQMNNSSDSPP